MGDDQCAKCDGMYKEEWFFNRLFLISHVYIYYIYIIDMYMLYIHEIRKIRKIYT